MQLTRLSGVLLLYRRVPLPGTVIRVHRPENDIRGQAVNFVDIPVVPQVAAQADGYLSALKRESVKRFPLPVPSAKDSFQPGDTRR